MLLTTPAYTLINKKWVYYTCLKRGVLFNEKNTVSGCLKVKYPGNYLSLGEELTGREKNV
jgi:hypothetical protein